MLEEESEYVFVYNTHCKGIYLRLCDTVGSKGTSLSHKMSGISYKQSTPVISGINSHRTIKQEHLALLAKIFMQ